MEDSGAIATMGRACHPGWSMGISTVLWEQIQAFAISIDRRKKGRLADAVILLDDDHCKIHMVEAVKEHVGAIPGGDVQVWTSGCNTLGFRVRSLLVVGSVGRCHEEWMKQCFYSKIVTGSQAEEYLREVAA